MYSSVKSMFRSNIKAGWSELCWLRDGPTSSASCLTLLPAMSRLIEEFPLGGAHVGGCVEPTASDHQDSSAPWWPGPSSTATLTDAQTSIKHKLPVCVKTSVLWYLKHDKEVTSNLPKVQKFQTKSIYLSKPVKLQYLLFTRASSTNSEVLWLIVAGLTSWLDQHGGDVDCAGFSNRVGAEFQSNSLLQFYNQVFKWKHINGQLQQHDGREKFPLNSQC